MQDVIDALPLGASAKYDLSRDDMAFCLNHDRGLGFHNGGEPFCHVDCPLIYQISVDDLVRIREEIKRSVVSSKLYASCISDGGPAKGRESSS